MDERSFYSGNSTAPGSRRPLSVGWSGWCSCLLSIALSSCWPASAGTMVRAGPVPGNRTEAPRGQGTRVLIDLSKKETFVPLQINADRKDVEIANIQVKSLPSPHHLAPREGVVQYGEPVDIILKEPSGVRIRLSLVTRGDELALRVSPQVVLQGGETIELTQNRIERTGRSLQRRVKDLHQRLVALASARRRLKTWLISPGNKPLAAVKTARMRLKVLEQEIQLQQLELPVVQNQWLALQRIAEFAGQLDEQTEIRFTVHTRRGGRE